MPCVYKQTQQPTTPQRLGSIVKSAQDTMRNDKGLNGDLDRLPMLAWIMFLEFLHDMEVQRETEAALSGERFRPAIEAPYRWRDWAAKEDGILDIRNPNAPQDLGRRSPEELVESILENERRIAEIVAEIRDILARQGVG